MTRYCQRYRIAGTRPRHRAHGTWIADHTCQLCIAARLAHRNPAKGPPYPLLKRGAAQVERQVERLPGLLEEVQHGLHRACQRGIIGDELGTWEAVAEVPEQRGIRL